ncbi:MAG TPA: hypothetical protein DCZ92_01770 [Elusimicrobia bacterium]|nr:MAG: hypothetical protein A2016_07715 [Elusimicrobia bacterium GWF2_62_30]HBA59554.1 hypothetical protein [Elusimicrobiota bacterium]
MLKGTGKLFIALLLSFCASRSIAGDDTRSIRSDLKNPRKAEKLRTLAASSPVAARTLLFEAKDTNKTADYRCAALAALSASTDENVSFGIADAVMDPDPVVQACAARVAAETRNTGAVDALTSNVAAYLYSAGRKGPYEDNVRLRLKAINSIWALGEIGSPKVGEALEKFYSEADDVLKVNLVIGLGKQAVSARSVEYIRNVAASDKESEAVRAAAFEMLEEMGQEASVPGLAPSKSAGIEKGDLIYTGGIVGTIGSWGTTDLPVGHAGIFTGTETKDGRIYVLIGDCVPDGFIPPGVRNINLWKNFTHHFKFPYYGNRTSKARPSAAQRERIVALALELGKQGLKYSDSHFSQKGPKEFDCVGYTEYVYELAGLNPTENRYETGWGWPLTPWEQFEATVPNTAAALPLLAAAPETPREPGQAELELRKTAGVTFEVNKRITPVRVY